MRAMAKTSAWSRMREEFLACAELARAFIEAEDDDDIDDEYDQYHHIDDHRSTNHDHNVNFFDDVDDLDNAYNFDDVDDIDDLSDNDQIGRAHV